MYARGSRDREAVGEAYGEDCKVDLKDKRIVVTGGGTGMGRGHAGRAVVVVHPGCGRMQL